MVSMSTITVSYRTVLSVLKPPVCDSWRDGSAVKREHLLLFQRSQVQFPAPTQWLTTVWN